MDALTGMFYRGGSSSACRGGFLHAVRRDAIEGATTPATMSNTVASNIGPDATLVRSGQLDLAAGVLLPLGPFRGRRVGDGDSVHDAVHVQGRRTDDAGAIVQHQ